jgi:hypothetical protein
MRLDDKIGPLERKKHIQEINRVNFTQSLCSVKNKS